MRRQLLLGMDSTKISIYISTMNYDIKVSRYGVDSSLVQGVLYQIPFCRPSRLPVPREY